MRKDSLVVALAVAALGAAVPAGAQTPFGNECSFTTATQPTGLNDFSGSGIPLNQVICSGPVNGVTLYLSATPRLVPNPPVTESALGVFDASYGISQPATIRSTWNFDFAALGTETNPGDVFTLLIDGDPTSGVNFKSVTLALGSTDSENLGFGFSQDPTFNPFVSGTYTIELDQTSAAGVLENHASINVVVATPEPASLALMATGLLGLGGFVRRRNKRNAAI